jgi:hypothetical protein
MTEKKAPEARSNPATVVLAALDVLVIAPLGVGAAALGDAPATVKRVRQELNNARFIGRLTVNRSVSELRQRFESSTTPSTESETTENVDDVEAISATADALAQIPEAKDLALPDYDQLPAIDIVAKLGQLSASERGAIETYENANRQRRTVLGKLAQLNDLQ